MTQKLMVATILIIATTQIMSGLKSILTSNTLDAANYRMENIETHLYNYDK